MKKQKQVKIIPQLSIDVMLEILSRVPARSVGRFRTVSKLYYRLLSQPSFIKDHLRHGGGISTSKLIVQLIDTTAERNRYFCYPLDNNNNNNNNLTSSYEVNDLSNVIIGNYFISILSCNGLFCIINERVGLLALWNPTTREVTSLPPLKHDTNIIGFREQSRYRCTDACSHHYFFGHDSLNDDYKIVCVVCVCKLELDAETPIANTTYIYSHRSGCWKEIDEQAFPPYCITYTYDDCKFVHGKIHWDAYSSQDEEGRKHSQFIVSFDLATERYGTVPRPPSNHPGDDLNVCVFGGELCFYINCDYLQRIGFEMWVMREYGVEQSWFQLLSIIPIHNLLTCDHYNRSCVPLFQMKSGEILFKVFEDGDAELRTCIYLYNPKNNNFITVKSVRGSAYVSGHICIESLVKTSISSPQTHLQDKDGMF